ncbi:MFS transporter [Vibrio sp. S11_S32]|uniref:MFS transporter n=2 Tax=Vibrionaceae TaxID=641 RepID=A0A5Q0TFV5_9VIBR|nr:MFS transporter [Vibrio sp. S11_S32]
MFLAAIDQTLLAAATPAIAQDLGGIQTAAWIAIGYLLANAASVPIYGWLGDRYGRRNVLISALVVFSIGSVIAALASSMTVLIIARVIQGIGGGGLMSLSQALIGELIPPRQRARFQGYFSSLFTLASVCGPVAGGLVVHYFTWHWLFWANLPIAAFAIYRLMSLKTTELPVKSRSIDGWGLMIFPTITTLLIYWLSAGGREFSWSSITSIELLVAIAVLTIAFILQQIRTTESFLPLALLAKKEIYVPLTSSFLFAACMFALIFFLPIYLQLGLGANAAMAGLLLLPLTCGNIIGSYTTGKVIAHTGVPKWLPVIGMSITTFGFVMLGVLEPSSFVTGLFGFFCGLGLGTVMPSTQLLIQTIGGKANLGRITAMAALFRSLGASMGTALFGTLTYSLIPGFTSDSTIVDLLTGPKDVIISAFQTGFLVAGALAFITVLNAARAPRISLDDY